MYKTRRLVVGLDLYTYLVEDLPLEDLLLELLFLLLLELFDLEYVVEDL